MMMALGQFVFSLNTLAYQELQRKTAYRHAANPRVGARDARQFVGPGDDSITLSGLLAPDFMGSLASLDELRNMAELGDAYALVDGEGSVYGAFVIENVSEGQTFHTKEGRPRRVEFSIDLVRVDDRLATGSGATVVEESDE